MKKLLVMSVVAAMAASSIPALASTVTYDQSLTVGWNNGSGNPNGGFTVDTENGIELGLRAKLRQSPSVIDSGNNTYFVPPGPQIASPSHAAWNYEFSIAALSGGSLAGYTASLTITDINTGATATVNPLTYWSDNTTTASYVQNSENPEFSDFPLSVAAYNTVGPLGFDQYADHSYTFDLSVNNAAGALVARDVIQVNVVPLPSAATMGGGALLLLGVAAMARKKLRTA